MRPAFATLGMLFCLVVSLPAQKGNDPVKGRVLEKQEDGREHPLVGANVYWLGTQTGAITGDDGRFSLPKLESHDLLVVSFVGYRNDTVKVTDARFISVTLSASIELREVTIVHRQRGTQISTLDPIKVEKINEKELLKAACCNLSESFETNPSVDVAFTDAVTGTKQIQMLGLAGPYTQITRENMPDVRGLTAIYGLTHIPGPWIERIMLNKGTGSAVNGYESIAGQIDVHLRDPESMDRLYINVYGNEDSRLEMNAAWKASVNEQLGTALLLHGSNSTMRQDRNEDGFLDMPLNRQYIALNRWELHNEKGSHVELGIKGLYSDNTGGQVDFDTDRNADAEAVWGMKLKLRRLEGWAKAGRVNPEKPWQSTGLQVSGVTHQQESLFGLTAYDATQQSVYGNLIHQGILGSTAHKYRTGLSFQYDRYHETFNQTIYNRLEAVPGLFAEYTYSYLEHVNVVAGLRTDYHNRFGWFVTPRIHVRYAATKNTILRLSGGRGQRTVSLFSENHALLSSSRQLILQGMQPSMPYGFEPEVAWNYGFNITQVFTLDYRHGTISADFYRTDFQQQVVMDLEQSPQQALFYNLHGKSYSNSFQLQVDYELIKRLDIRMAYRWYDVQTTYSGKLMERPLVSRHRAFINVSYSTRNHWAFDATANGQGPKRIPYTGSNPEAYRLPEKSPGFMVVNVHIGKTWREKFEVYAGVENLFDFRQPNPVLASDQPFSPYFDSSLIWGPVFGRNIYAGMRFRVK